MRLYTYFKKYKVSNKNGVFLVFKINQNGNCKYLFLLTQVHMSIHCIVEND